MILILPDSRFLSRRPLNDSLPFLPRPLPDLDLSSLLSFADIAIPLVSGYERGLNYHRPIGMERSRAI